MIEDIIVLSLLLAYIFTVSYICYLAHKASRDS